MGGSAPSKSREACDTNEDSRSQMKSTMDKGKGASSSSTLPNEAFLRKCLEDQALDYLQRKSGCFNLMVIGEDGLGKVSFLESLFSTRVGGLRETRSKVIMNNDPFNRENPMQILVEKLILNKTDQIQPGSERGLRPGKLTVRLMTTVNYGVTDGCRQPWNVVAEYISKQVNQYVNARAANPLMSQIDDDQRVHCCLYFIPPVGGKGLRRSDLMALKTLEDRVNLIPVLAKSDCYTAQELQERKEAVAADIERNGVQVHQYLDTKEAWMQQPMAVIGANFPETTRCMPWGTVSVEDERYCDVPLLKTLILEKNMLILRKTTKRLHASAMKTKPATLPRK